ncbi:MAG: cytochrome c peroxidase [Saprospiraceae bacterium]|nr:cytochrome c peroxidase [Saprospiraceae bacterium]
MKRIYLLAAISCSLLVISCKNNPDFNYYYYTPEEQALLSQYLNLPAIPADYTVVLPKYLTFSSFGFSQPPEPAKIELGRVLFYDKNLSKDGKISCASCHQQSLAFGDNAAVSKGVFDRAGERNSIALSSVPSFSAAYENTGNSLFWDNRAQTVQEQSRASLQNVKEMDMSMSEVVDAVNNQPYYALLFKKAFNETVASEALVTDAIQSFVHTLSSLRSKFDETAEAKFLENTVNFNFISENFAGLTAQENKGKTLYLNNCASCHTATVIAPSVQSASNGLDEYPADPGVGGITNFALDMGTFKVPALRNVGLTAPYMHDGRFQTLEQVVEHYSTGIKPHNNLHKDLQNTNGTPKKMNFNTQDKEALIAFLRSLSDEKMTQDKRFANPFK